MMWTLEERSEVKGCATVEGTCYYTSNAYLLLLLDCFSMTSQTLLSGMVVISPVSSLLASWMVGVFDLSWTFLRLDGICTIGIPRNRRTYIRLYFYILKKVGISVNRDQVLQYLSF